MKEVHDALKRIEARQSQMEQNQSSMQENQIEIKADLKYHIKRTDMLEDLYEKEVRPMGSFVRSLKLLGKILGVISLLIGMAVGISRIAKADESVDMVDALERVMVRHKCEIIVTSGHRTVEENKRVGGAPYSYHLSGRAFDIVSTCVSPKELGDEIRKNEPKLTVIYYKSHIHVDNRKHKKCLIKVKKGFQSCNK
jgi:hypothetical protein